MIKRICRHCSSEIYAGWTLYGIVWTAVEQHPSGCDREACPGNVGTLIQALGSHEPPE
ncbi:hypothetical protein JOL79_11110 [Microbispora sp. RL4-1S]|uniref:Uncharacterized protein n=1 Tax=Microbispora oryzae TaxID=2806554 RepID=A0A940WNP8_9ACTN|nr:hypothetical protein [Microbispora oryzae]MBP2704361.1 hypothetical protein [Microbispora oryzae]